MTMREFLIELEDFKKYFSPEALEFYDELKNTNSIANSITEKGAAILTIMKDNKDKYFNIYTSKQLGELLFMPPRSVSGSMRKLITQGYVEKKSANPVSYGITENGMALIEELNVDKN